ncbi:MAG: EAL domain-containing protein, partial [Clostridiales bacterium]|nr:EAL domain-containing protein [Clostridiales bacterium]
ITESAAVRNTAQISLNVLAMKELGVSIVLDDFGEGFSSFYDLQKYPLDALKLNKSLIDNILSATGKAILKGLIQVGHELGMTILAEGVETDEQVEALQALNCDVIQGFRFYYPLPAWDAKEKILETLNEQQS